MFEIGPNRVVVGFSLKFKDYRIFLIYKLRLIYTSSSSSTTTSLTK